MLSQTGAERAMVGAVRARHGRTCGRLLPDSAPQRRSTKKHQSLQALAPMNTFNNPVLLITGAAKRIGAKIAEYFHNNGYDVVIHYHHSADEAEVLQNKLNALRPDSAKTLQADLRDVGAVQNMADAALTWRGRLDVLINNASSFYPTPLATTKEVEWDELMGSNLKGAFFLSQALAQALRNSNGCIINMTDIYADSGLFEHPVYSIAKAGVKAMTKALARELAPNVRVNGISPGAILWPENSAAESVDLDSIALRRTGDPQDIAVVAWFLAHEATYTTGQTIRVDGGRNTSMSL